MYDYFIPSKLSPKTSTKEFYRWRCLGTRHIWPADLLKYVWLVCNFSLNAEFEHHSLRYEWQFDAVCCLTFHSKRSEGNYLSMYFSCTFSRGLRTFWTTLVSKISFLQFLQTSQFNNSAIKDSPHFLSLPPRNIIAFLDKSQDLTVSIKKDWNSGKIWKIGSLQPDPQMWNCITGPTALQSGGKKAK